MENYQKSSERTKENQEEILEKFVNNFKCENIQDFRDFVIDIFEEYFTFDSGLQYCNTIFEILEEIAKKIDVLNSEKGEELLYYVLEKAVKIRKFDNFFNDTAWLCFVNENLLTPRVVEKMVDIDARGALLYISPFKFPNEVYFNAFKNYGEQIKKVNPNCLLYDEWKMAIDYWKFSGDYYLLDLINSKVKDCLPDFSPRQNKSNLYNSLFEVSLYREEIEEWMKNFNLGRHLIALNGSFIYYFRFQIDKNIYMITEMTHKIDFNLLTRDNYVEVSDEVINKLIKDFEKDGYIPDYSNFALEKLYWDNFRGVNIETQKKWIKAFVRSLSKEKVKAKFNEISIANDFDMTFYKDVIDLLAYVCESDEALNEFLDDPYNDNYLIGILFFSYINHYISRDPSKIYNSYKKWISARKVSIFKYLPKDLQVKFEKRFGI